MITRCEVFVILAIVLGTVSTCLTTNKYCKCDFILFERTQTICEVANNSSFIVDIKPEVVKIGCVNSPKWSEWFRLNISFSTEHKKIELMLFESCDLPANNSLYEIIQTLGVTDVINVTFTNNRWNFSLNKHHLDNLKHLNLHTLNFAGNEISYVDEDLFADLVNLKGLNLRSNKLHQVTGLFNYTPELRWIELGDNALQSIELGTFDNLKKMVFLNLWGNQIELQLGVFDELITLDSLDISGNKMMKLPEDIFAKLTNLSTINLSFNYFTHLPKNLLQNNKGLYKFRMHRNNRNMTLPNGFFANLTKLETLGMIRSKISTLPEDVFWGCTSLTLLQLKENYLRILPLHIFRDLENLDELQLADNLLENLPDNIFLKTNKLTKLDLSNNRITSISDNLFKGLNDLTEINMEYNHLTTISNYGFSSLQRLKTAMLSHNFLTLQQTFPFQFELKSPFYDCLLLEALYLANNSISDVFNDWIVSIVNLKKLDLSYNNISSISTEDLQFVSNDIEVDFTHNKIEHIILSNAELFADSQETNYYKEDRPKILVDNNPVHCDCKLYDFLRYIEGRMHPNVKNYFEIIPGNLTCQSPKELKNVRVKDLKSKLLTCTKPKLCSEKCDCRERPEDKVLIFDCSHKNLTSIPSDIKKSDKVSQFELNFSGNRLTRMPDLKTIEFNSVKKLILSHNAISEISLDGLSNTLQVVELHNNNVSRIHPDVLEFLKQSNLTQLTLHENPWECDCNAKDFLNFIQTKLVTIPNLLKVTCPGRNISVAEMTVNDFCPLHTTAIIGISIAISLTGLLIGICGLLYYKYQRQIKVWLFAHQWCLWFVTEEELDKDKLYDAFVSYSHKDQDFVVNELVPKLENGPTSFKLCLHYRDWLAGEWIPANIASSVENSRRTIVVLSPNFLESVWGRMEFRAAHSQALSEGRARVILILYGDIGPTDDLDPELKAYISMNTYVKWGDPWFWNKLRYALPHQPKLTRNSIIGKKIFENQLCIISDSDKKQLTPIKLPETPLTTTPPIDALKKFICDKESEEKLFFNSNLQDSCKLNGNIESVLSPDNLMNRNEECLV